MRRSFFILIGELYHSCNAYVNIHLSSTSVYLFAVLFSKHRALWVFRPLSSKFGLLQLVCRLTFLFQPISSFNNYVSSTDFMDLAVLICCPLLTFLHSSLVDLSCFSWIPYCIHISKSSAWFGFTFWQKIEADSANDEKPEWILQWFQNLSNCWSFRLIQFSFMKWINFYSPFWRCNIIR